MIMIFDQKSAIQVVLRTKLNRTMWFTCRLEHLKKLTDSHL